MNFNEISQLTVNGLIDGSFYGLIGIGFGLILGVTGRFHFAFAATMVFGTYVATVLAEAGVPLYLGLLVGIVVGTVAGMAIEAVIYRPLVDRAGDKALLSVFVSALGITIVVENLIRLIWGSQARALGYGFTNGRIDLWGDVSITRLSLFVFVVCAVLIAAVQIWMQRSRQGRAIRAVRVNPAMACAVGISPGRMFLLVFGIGSAISVIGGLLYAMRFAASPEMATEPTFDAIVVAFLAGMAASPLRFAIAGVIIGLIESISTLWISSSWAQVVTFGALFIYIAALPYLTGGSIKGLLRLLTPRAAGAGS